MIKRFNWALFLGLIALSTPALRAQGEVNINVNGSTPMNYNVQTTQPSMQNMPMGGVQWLSNYQQAADQAKRENKYILLFFTGSDWCGWCKKIESEVFADANFARTVGNRFVFVELDFPMNRTLPPEISQQNAQLKQRFGITGFPTIIILDPNQNFVAETGYRPGGGKQYADYLLQLTQGGSQSGSSY